MYAGYTFQMEVIVRARQLKGTVAEVRRLSEIMMLLAVYI
jgi:hypothetical protein